MSASRVGVWPTSTVRPLATIIGRALRDRLKTPLVAGAALAVLSVFGMAAFSGIDSGDLFKHLPPSFDNLLGGRTGGNYVVSEIFGLIAPIVVLVVGISGGVAAVAGEERDRTADLLLAQPVRRRDLVVAKAAALVVHLLLAVTVFAAGFLIGSAFFDSGIAPGDACATAVHLLTLGLAFAMIALALSSWTGSAPISITVAAGLAVVADLMSSMLPLVSGLENAAKASPWYYYNGSQPLVNGLDPLHLAVLLVIGGAAFTLALVGVERRDIDSGVHSRVLSIPSIDTLTRPRVGSIFLKSLSERVVIIAVAGWAASAMAVGVALMFNGLQPTLSDLSKNIPSSVAGLYGAADLGTSVGWINGEMLSIYVPALIVGVAVVIGIDAVAGEQQRHTLALILATPITRRRFVIEKAAALLVAVVVISGMSGFGILVGSALAGLDLAALNVIAALTHAALLGLFFGALALGLGAATSAVRATRVVVVAGLGSYMAQAFLPNAAALQGLTVLSPWHYYNSSDPLVNGFDPLHLGVLAALTIISLSAAVILLQHRDVDA